MEIIKFFQGVLIESEKMIRTPILDIDGQETGKYMGCSVNNSALNEELGQVNYLLSDKTGTLTANKMEFGCLMIGDSIFGNATYNADGEIILDTELSALLEENTEAGEKARLALKCMALCHDAEFDHTQVLQSSSPENLALLDFCNKYGYRFYQSEVAQGKRTLVVIEQETEFRYSYLDKIEFTSDRMRMSVVVEFQGQVFVFTKGADDVIRDLLMDNKSKELELLDQNMNEAGTKGLRTLMLAYKVMTLKEWENFSDALKQAKLADNVDANVHSLYTYLEKGLILLGAAAVEDKLQDRVANSVRVIREAGIKFWMVTGDRSDTAVSVSQSAGILDIEMEIIKYADVKDINVENFSQLDRRIRALPDGRKVCSLVNGNFLTALQDTKQLNSSLYREFIDLLMRSEAAIFSRVNPRQKQEVVGMIREYDSSFVILAIGDGANDVNMITSAHVGIGIKRLETPQAANAADYSFGEFHHLIPLMFYFGRECYRKNAVSINYNFYKNFLLVMPQFWFGFFNFFAGQTLYEAWMYQIFNFLFSMLPIIVFGIYDKSRKKSKFLFAPLLYKTGQYNVYFNGWRFATTFIVTSITGLYICVTSLGFFDWGAYHDGHSYGFWNFGHMVYLAVVIIINVKILSISNSSSVFQYLSILLSLALFLLMWFLLSSYERKELFNSFSEIFNGVQFYLYLVVVFGICVFEYLCTLLEYHFSISKHEAEYEVTFDVNKLSRIDEHEQPRLSKRSSKVSTVNSNSRPNNYRTFDDDYAEYADAIPSKVKPIHKHKEEEEDIMEGSFYTDRSNVSD